eukprot:6882731-Ditylum_brightwellii.AAC.1
METKGSARSAYDDAPTNLDQAVVLAYNTAHYGYTIAFILTLTVQHALCAATFFCAAYPHPDPTQKADGGKMQL